MKTAKTATGRWTYVIWGALLMLLLLRAVFPDFFAGLIDGLTGVTH